MTRAVLRAYTVFYKIIIKYCEKRFDTPWFLAVCCATDSTVNNIVNSTVGPARERPACACFLCDTWYHSLFHFTWKWVASPEGHVTRLHRPIFIQKYIQKCFSFDFIYSDPGYDRYLCVGLEELTLLVSKWKSGFKITLQTAHLMFV